MLWRAAQVHAPVGEEGSPRSGAPRTHALAAVKAFVELFGAKFGRAVAKITDDVEELLAFYDYPPSTGSTCAPRTVLDAESGAVVLLERRLPPNGRPSVRDHINTWSFTISTTHPESTATDVFGGPASNRSAPSNSVPTTTDGPVPAVAAAADRTGAIPDRTGAASTDPASRPAPHTSTATSLESDPAACPHVDDPDWPGSNGWISDA